MSKIGIIGGSGLDDPDILEGSSETSIKTPYGDPSSKIKEGKIEGQHVAVLSRHGVDHSISPTNVNFRANIWALKKIGVKFILTVSACGSLKEEMSPGDIVIPDQAVDFTKLRPNTFFGENCVGHVGMADPFCPYLSKVAYQAASKVVEDTNSKNASEKNTVHPTGTVVTIEGPRFSTKVVYYVNCLI